MVALLDISVLIALAWRAHESHERAQHWFSNHARKGWATCPITQAGFVRILSNPAFARDAVSPKEALRILRTNISHPSHHFWGDEISVLDALTVLQTPIGHRQITDAYLIGLAIHKGGKFVTFDERALSLLPESPSSRAHFELISSPR